MIKIMNEKRIEEERQNKKFLYELNKRNRQI